MPKANLRDEILEAGFESLYSGGFNATSVHDIAKAANAPKGSFYNHFESKEALGVAVVKRYAERGEDSRRALLNGPSPPLARLRAHFEALIERNTVGGLRGCLLGNFAAELSGQSEEIRGNVAHALDLWTGCIAQVLEEAMKAGDLPRSAGEPNALAAAIIDSWEGAVLRAKARADCAPLDNFLAVTLPRLLR